jgi:hypothetical protein
VKAIEAIWKDGRIILTQSVDWPDGTTLTVKPIAEPHDSEADGDISGNDPDSIARWIALYDDLPPLQMTEAEEAEWRSARSDMKDHTIGAMSKLSIEGKP